MTIVKADGILRHFFHGSYSCGIGLQFANEQDCDDALKQLNIGEVPNLRFGNWHKSDKYPHMALGALGSEQLKAFKSKFHPKCKPCNDFDCKGENRIHEIDGVDHSVDVGPPFDVEFEVENHNQGNLF